MPAPELPPSAALINLISGTWVTQLIYVAAKLGLADRLRDGPKPVEELASATGMDPQSLYRVLRALASFGVFRETAPRCFELTPLAHCLRSDVPDSLQAVAVFYGEPWHRAAWSSLLHSVKTAQPAFNHVAGEPFFEHVQKHPEVAAIFDQAMTNFSGMAIGAVLAAYDFTGIGKLVDVAGGHGSLLAAILQAYPAMRGVLFDMPTVIDGARQKQLLEQAGVADRCELVGGDFFRAVPAGADGYLMKHIIHDWSDDHALNILRNCRRAMSPSGRLLLVEMVIPPGNEPHFGKLLDLEMLVMTQGGRERTESEYRALLAAAGFELTRIVPTRSPASVIEGQPI
ncbi:MAG: methyltransferase [Planctomycetia bacterium]|nr:methyltransferase [Planctomycetia bacterium]